MSPRRALSLIAAFSLIATARTPAAAQSDRPLTTEPAQTLTWGEVQVELGVSSFRTRGDPGERGYLWNVPTVAAVAGIGPAADLKVEGSAVVSFNPERGESVREPGDFTFWTKVRFWRGTPFQPVVAGRIGVKIPVTSDESGLGTDETDFFAQAILSQNIAQSRLNLNLGLSILGDPRQRTTQNDAFAYGVSWVVPLSDAVRVVGEVAGRQGPGTLFDSSFARLGARWNAAGVVWDAALSAGFIDSSEDWGVLAGVVLPFTWKPKEGTSTL
jgi:hypothetical protein